jgi:Putative prokaryotic signal transducing protein
MSLVTVLTPETEVELLSVVAMLEARNVRCFVHSAGLGSLYPGAPPIESVNARAIMVPQEQEAEARALVADFLNPSSSTMPEDEFTKLALSYAHRTMRETLSEPQDRTR